MSTKQITLTNQEKLAYEKEISFTKDVNGMRCGHITLKDGYQISYSMPGNVRAAKPLIKLGVMERIEAHLNK